MPLPPQGPQAAQSSPQETVHATNQGHAPDASPCQFSLLSSSASPFGSTFKTSGDHPTPFPPAHSPLLSPTSSSWTCVVVPDGLCLIMSFTYNSLLRESPGCFLQKKSELETVAPLLKLNKLQTPSSDPQGCHRRVILRREHSTHASPQCHPARTILFLLRLPWSWSLQVQL